MKKFSLPAGTTNRHQWHKDAAKAVRGVTNTFNMLRQKYGTIGGDETDSLVTVFGFGSSEYQNPEAVAIYEALGERFGWQITRDNAAEIAEAFREALPKCMATVKIEDNRKTPEENAERNELNRTQEAERKAANAETADRVEAIAAELRKQYPDAEPKGDKSEHARASANLKRLLQARGLRASVKSSSYSMGDSVTAHVKTPDIDPDTRKELDELAERFSYSTFDPMTDCSGYKRDDESAAWRLVHGSTKYCRIDWQRSDENRAAAVAFLGGSDHESHSLWSGAHCRSAEFWAKWAQDHAPDPTGPFQISGVYSVEKHHHTKRGFDFWLVVLAEKVERDEFTRLRDSCKDAGGWYSRKWGKTPGGFAFTEQERAGTWAIQEFSGHDSDPDGNRAAPEPKQSTPQAGTSKKRGAMAGRFRDMAEKLDAEVTAKRGDHQENTPKRQREAMSRRIDADRLERTAQGLRALADLHEAGAVPETLAKFTSKKAVFDALGVRTVSNGYYHVGATGEHSDESPEASALWALIDGKDPEQEKADKLAETMAGLPKIPGYFPTPPELVAQMVDALNINHRRPWTLLEPSAGTGAILDEVEQLANEPEVATVYEISPTLCEVLRGKGYDARPIDFMEQEPGLVRYDAVLMNPPFEKMADVDHVRHAYDFLKPGGRLVAITGPGWTYQSKRKAEEFRAWFEELGGEVEDLPAGSFKDSGTSVNACMVVIDKPEEVEESEPLCKGKPHLGTISKSSADWLAGEVEQLTMF